MNMIMKDTFVDVEVRRSPVPHSIDVLQKHGTNDLQQMVRLVSANSFIPQLF